MGQHHHITFAIFWVVAGYICTLIFVEFISGSAIVSGPTNLSRLFFCQYHFARVAGGSAVKDPALIHRLFPAKLIGPVLHQHRPIYLKFVEMQGSC